MKLKFKRIKENSPQTQKFELQNQVLHPKLYPIVTINNQVNHVSIYLMGLKYELFKILKTWWKLRRN